MLEPRQHARIVRVEGRHQQRASAVSVVGNSPHQRKRLDRRGEHQFLARAQPQANAHGNLGQPVKLIVEGE
jgi:hypothetical protein